MLSKSLRASLSSQFTVSGLLCPLGFRGEEPLPPLISTKHGRSHQSVRFQEVCGELTHLLSTHHCLFSFWLRWIGRAGLALIRTDMCASSSLKLYTWATWNPKLSRWKTSLNPSSTPNFCIPLLSPWQLLNVTWRVTEGNGNSTGVLAYFGSWFSQAFLFLDEYSLKERRQMEEGLPEGTAAVPKGTEPNMSALAGSVWDEDGIKASPGVAGVCQDRERQRVHEAPRRWLIKDGRQHVQEWRVCVYMCVYEWQGSCVLQKRATVQACYVVCRSGAVYTNYTSWAAVRINEIMHLKV